jgi:hypothetical protein
MYRFGSTDSGNVAVTLIGEYDVVGMRSLDTCCNSRSASVCGLDHIAFKEVICKYRASDGCNADGLALDSELIDNLGYKAVYDTVGTAGAICVRYVGKGFRSIKYY